LVCKNKSSRATSPPRIDDTIRGENALMAPDPADEAAVKKASVDGKYTFTVPASRASGQSVALATRAE
jgi:hypothetical protein